jgi:hypothetical protein
VDSFYVKLPMKFVVVAVVWFVGGVLLVKIG